MRERKRERDGETAGQRILDNIDRKTRMGRQQDKETHIRTLTEREII
jgi:hypothetical protein